MQRKFIDMQFFGTYYFMNIVQNVGFDPFPYIRNLEGFWGDEGALNFIDPFPRESALHYLASFVIDATLDEELEQELGTRPVAAMLPKLWVERAMDLYGLKYETFEQWLTRERRVLTDITAEDASDYFTDLSLSSDSYVQLIERLAGEVFFHLFMNRRFLARFNEHIASIVIRDMDPADLDVEAAKHFARPGVLRRVTIPEWVRNAVFFRDRGICVLCHSDLTGLVNIHSESNFDHIVPLARGGMNDVTNIQLLCGGCNKRKSAGSPATSAEVEAWY